MRILVLGGTVFLGRAIVAEALRRGHSVATFNRGLAGSSPEAVETFIGDRASLQGLSALRGQRFDAVIDTSRQAVSHVRRAVDDLGGDIGCYLFVSTASVYSQPDPAGTDETAEVAAPLMNPTAEQEADLSNYPALNVACEHIVAQALSDRHLILRSGLIVGDHDPSDRFGYWPVRIARGGRILVPDPPDQNVQIVDVRDLAAFAITALEHGLGGTYNVMGPRDPLPLASLLDSCAAFSRDRGIAAIDLEYTWVGEKFLLDRDVRPYLDLPLWVPQDPEGIGFTHFRVGRAQAAGLTYRPLVDTIAAAFDWELALGLDRQRKAGLDPEVERQLLQLWDAVRA